MISHLKSWKTGIVGLVLIGLGVVRLWVNGHGDAEGMTLLTIGVGFVAAKDADAKP